MITGSIVALATPMKATGEIDWDALRQLVAFHLENGTDAIVAAGTTGEPTTMSFAEHFDVIRCVVETVAGKIPVIAGTGANATSEAVELARYAKEVGADYCLSVAPYYNKPTQEGLYQHFKAVAEQAGIPVILYNVPGRTCSDIYNETVFRLAELDNIVGLKDATGNLERGQELIDRLKGTDFALYSGDDPTACDFILMGGHGDISVTANVAPRLMHEMCEAAVAGDAERAHQINTRLMPLHSAMGVESNPIPVKFAMHRMGLSPESGVRLPLTWLSEQYHSTVEEALQLAEVLN
ncbi:4-hydroxy-tetrahydrodipicolinate synthase [Cobetia sp. cqz5-12]|jgi:4-hydroxy-tetrahydrodipicolinate synthase|uniref:4-hydroxy-tetrahydrodipicolinate synthase n=1 Tax=Cobetia amphilecti TaxID=1055104 RepID=A0AAP4X0V7_9GAMM|nr:MULTISPECIES: 4-hydroxy-tetrahydrodipicolinate synthase [Cobetia]AVV34562.1 4-hydroxy-tetrahydrodipicolinate synthase [Halomonas sp. SF2003]MBR9755753.1 4-hydroxy-tetrahydrodipicolinate synthase [Gammaproteobacteria bacterium]NVN57069.1 4-hydroxy-tetrahydrodipicolinate synthase [bacterium Scap17]TCJ27126.1 4-hydroxy-tetrahydrodipicolinate synthase [Halomonas sp. GDM18]KGA01087.1 dihydrodipicolinate synthase [Cobetia amphilecti]|tara:strand:- start:1739 stop:2623 length:885 start_codon:yes stop_codon:yes gene_type:complete